MVNRSQRVLESFIPEFLSYKNNNTFTDEELRHIIEKRKDFENNLDNLNKKMSFYKNYLKYELTLLEYRKTLHKIENYAGDLQIKHIVNIYKGCLTFFNDFDVFKEFIAFCFEYDICIKKSIMQRYRLNLSNLDETLFCIKKLTEQFFSLKNTEDRDFQLHEIKNIRELCIETNKLFSSDKKFIEFFIENEKKIKRFCDFYDFADFSKESEEIISLLKKDLIS